jgi:hypothetical protein
LAGWLRGHWKSLRNLAIGALRLAGHPTSPQRYDRPAATRPGPARPLTILGLAHP